MKHIYWNVSLIFDPAIINIPCFQAQSEGHHDGVQSGARPHGRRHLDVVRAKVAAQVHGFALGSIDLRQDLVPVGGQLFRDGGETRLEIRVLFLGGQGQGPVGGQMDVATPVIQFLHLAAGGLVVDQEILGGFVQCPSQHACLGVAVELAQVFQEMRPERQTHPGNPSAGVPLP